MCAYLQFLLIYWLIKSTVTLLKILYLIPSYREIEYLEK